MVGRSLEGGVDGSGRYWFGRLRWPLGLLAAGQVFIVVVVVNCRWCAVRFAAMHAWSAAARAARQTSVAVPFRPLTFLIHEGVCTDSSSNAIALRTGKRLQPSTSPARWSSSKHAEMRAGCSGWSGSVVSSCAIIRSSYTSPGLSLNTSASVFEAAAFVNGGLPLANRKFGSTGAGVDANMNGAAQPSPGTALRCVGFYTGGEGIGCVGETGRHNRTG